MKFRKLVDKIGNAVAIIDVSLFLFLTGFLFMWGMIGFGIGMFRVLQIGSGSCCCQ